MLKEGLRRRIGNGAATRILHDPWLRVDERPIITQTLSPVDGRMVCSLFINGSREWDEDVVRDLFVEDDANLIIGIPLSTAAEDDSWFWSKERDVFYSVKKCI